MYWSEASFVGWLELVACELGEGGGTGVALGTTMCNDDFVLSWFLKFEF